VRYELGFYKPEDNILHSHRRDNIKSYKTTDGLPMADSVKPIGFEVNQNGHYKGLHFHGQNDM
jgi:hypothetical protein